MAAIETTKPLPGLWRLGWVSTRLEVKAFYREKAAMIFVFSLPAVLMLLLGSIFKSMATLYGVTVGQLFAAGLIGGGIAATSFQYLGISIATERDRRMLKRLRVTPMPKTAYFLGKIGLVGLATMAEAVLLVAVGMLIDHLSLPSSPQQWWTLAWVLVLGSVCFTLLGIAASSMAKSARSAPGIITLPFIVLQFMSGVFVPMTVIPGWLRDIASFFPLKWICQGLRSAFLPARAAHLEAAGTWEHGRTLLVLVAWIVAGLILCLTTFRWRSNGDG